MLAFVSIPMRFSDNHNQFSKPHRIAADLIVMEIFTVFIYYWWLSFEIEKISANPTQSYEEISFKVFLEVMKKETLLWQICWEMDTVETMSYGIVAL